MRQIVIDTETTGLETSQGHKIIEIGAVELINRQFTGKHFHYYLNPQREIDAGALQVHGLTQAFLADKPIFADIADELIAFISEAELVIHNAPFDIGFFNYELSLIKHASSVITDICQVIDTLPLARQRHPGQKNSLDALCKRYGVDNSKREYHGALLDAQLLAHVYLAMTGGQTTLFGEETIINNRPQTSSRQPVLASQQNRPPLLIIKATDDEETAHRKRLAEIAKQAENGCLWQRLDYQEQ